MRQQKELEPGLYRKPCGCDVLMGPFRQVISELRCAAEGRKRLKLADLVEIPDEEFIYSTTV